MKFTVEGTILQTLSIDLDIHESIFSQTSMMAWMNDKIKMETHTNGGFIEGIKRSMGGGSFFITEFTSRGHGQIAFAPKFPGKILSKTLVAGESFICRKESFLCAEKSIHLDIDFQKKIGAGLFGGEGFILQKVTGPGTVWLDLSGEVIMKELKDGEKLFVHPGHIGIQSPTIDFDIEMVSGFKNILFGGEGLFLATLTGPGRVWLQSMPIINLAQEIGRHLPERNSSSSNSPAGDGGALVGGLISGLLGGKDD